MRAYQMADGGGSSPLNRGMAKPISQVPQKTINPVAPIAAPAPVAAPAAVTPQGTQSWDQYKTSLDWNNSDVNNGIGGLANHIGYSGPIQERTGNQKFDYEGESGPVYSDEWGPSAQLAAALKDYRFTPGIEGGNSRTNPNVTAFDPYGNQVGNGWRTGSGGGSAMKIAGKVIPALAMAGFGVGALGALGAGGAGAAAGAGEAGLAGLGELGINTALGAEAGMAGTAGLSGLGELGINTALPAAVEGGALGIPGASYALPGAETGFGVSNIGAAAGGAGIGEAAAYTTAAADSQLANTAMQAAGNPLAAATSPSAVNLGSLGGVTSTAAGGFPTSIAEALTAAKSGLSSVGAFAKANPQLAALGISGATTLLNGSGGKPPAIPGSGGGSGGTSNDALVQALTDKLYGPNGSMSNSFDYSSVPALKTSAGEVGQFNQAASDAAYNNATRYLDPQIAQQQQALEARLAEQGFVPGTPGYKQAMGNFMDKNQMAYASARDTATLQGFSQGNNQFNQSRQNADLNNAASRETLAQLLAQRNQPLNELNSLKTGQQLAYDNQMGQYNADVMSKNSTNQALSQLALALGSYLG